MPDETMMMENGMMMKRIVLLVLMASAAFGQDWPLTDPGNSAGWIRYEPMWDEFDGTELDSEKWEPIDWEGREPVYHDFNNVSLSGGKAILTTTWTDGTPLASVSTNKDNYGISAGYFQSTTQRRYGYFEIKCRALDLPVVTGWWFTGGGRAYTREIDMLECPSGVPGKYDYYSCNFHIWSTPTPEGVDDNGGSSIPDPEHYDLPFNMIDDFHVYGFEWDKDFCKIYIDGVLYRTKATESFKVGQRLMIGNEFNEWLSPLDLLNDNLDKVGNSYDVEYVRSWIKPETDALWYVDAEHGDDANDGTSWATAKATIQGAVNEAYDGDSIWVARGYYQEYVTFHGMNNLKVYGGFVNGATDLSEQNPLGNPTIIHAPPDGYSPVCIKGNDGFRLDGFTVMGATGAWHEHGIDVEGPCTNVVIANCRLMQNHPSAGGSGGAYVDGVGGADSGFAHTEVLFENCEISENTSPAGSSAAFGLRNGAVVEMNNCRILNNSALNEGGAMSMLWGSNTSTLRMEDCVISGNENKADTGVISFNCGNVELINCTVTDNSADGVEQKSWSSPSVSLINTIVANNGGEGFYSQTSNFELKNNLFYANTGGQVNYGGDKNTATAINGLSQASGNVVGDPLFFNDANLDYRLTAGSAAIGAALAPSIDVGAHQYEADQPAQWAFAQMSIPGRIEAENFDYGGEGVAYHDTTTENQGGFYRFEGPDVEFKAGQMSPNVGWCSVGEWMEYTVDVTPGTYTLRALAGSVTNISVLRVSLDGEMIADLSIPDTDSWTVFDFVETNVTVTGGMGSVLKLEILGSGQNINWIEFYEKDSDGDGIPDGWEEQYGTDVYADDTGVDYDGDGFTTWEEYLAGTHPKNANSHFVISGGAISDQFNVGFTSAVSRVYAVDVTDDLRSGWTEWTNGVSGTGDFIELTDPVLVSNRFYRVKVGLE